MAQRLRRGCGSLLLLSEKCLYRLRKNLSGGKSRQQFLRGTLQVQKGESMKRIKATMSLIVSSIMLALPVANIASVVSVKAHAQKIARASHVTDASNQASKLTKMPDDLRIMIDLDRNGNQSRNVIVEINERPNEAARQVIERNGGHVKHQFQSINALLVEMPLSRIAALSLEQSVVFITPDRKVERSMAATAKLVGANKLANAARLKDDKEDNKDQPGDKSDGDTKYPAIDGNGIGVAVIDSGVSAANKDLGGDDPKREHSRLFAFKDFAGSVKGTKGSDSYDDYGHGTAVAGIIAGTGWGSRQLDGRGVEWYPGNYGDFKGIAPRANLLSVKAIDRNGNSTISTVIQSIGYVISVKAQYNIKVINLSLGTAAMQSYKTDPLCQAVERAIAGGIVVCAAGNFGHNDTITGYDSAGKAIYQTVYGGIHSPGNDPKVITVGATKDPQQTLETWSGNSGVNISPSPNPLRRTDLQVASYSSRGPTLVDGIIKPDLVAPGTKIITTNSLDGATLTDQILPNSVLPLTGKSGSQPIAKMYCQLTGTSFATPVVSGIVALMVQANQKLTPAEVKGILRLTAQQLPSLSSKNQIERMLSQGAGLVNAYAAVRLAQNVRPDPDRATAGQRLLKPGVTLTKLNQDLKLNLYDQSGRFLEYGVHWSALIANCGANAACINAQRKSVSAAFFVEQEFQDTGGFVYRFYKASYGQRPTFEQFMMDRSSVVGGTNLEASKLLFAEAWVQRPEFIAKYPSNLTGAQFIASLLATVQQNSGIDLSSQSAALNADYAANASRARIIRQVADNTAFQKSEYNNGFVLMQYFGYLRRDPEQSGYDFWLNVLNNRLPNDSSGYRSMVCGFITSREYQERFSSVVTHTDQECGQ